MNARPERADKGGAANLSELLSRLTISVPDCGMLIFGLSRNGSYEAANR
jgi:hypothetical protein